MGLFDDLLGVAKEFGDIKTEITDTFRGAVDDITNLKEEASDTVTGLKDEASAVKDNLLSSAEESSGQE